MIAVARLVHIEQVATIISRLDISPGGRCAERLVFEP
jgi:hypothetical protein